MNLPIRLLLLLTPLCLVAQPTKTEELLPPIALDEFLEYLSTPGFIKDPATIREAIQRSGIAFPLDPEVLVKILKAARTGKQPDEFSANLILEVLRACVGCRDRYFGALNLQELLTLINRSLPPQVLIEEVRLRGTKDIPKTQETIDRLRNAKAPPGLITMVIPDHELLIPTPPTHLLADLRPTADFSPTAPIGYLNIKVDVQGMAELLFVNNALFYRPIVEAAGKPITSAVSALTASFSAPAPAVMFDPLVQSVERLEKPGGRFSSVVSLGKAIGKEKQPVKVEFATNLAAGRPGIRISIEESDRKSPHTYEIQIQWNRPSGN